MKIIEHIPILLIFCTQIAFPNISNYLKPVTNKTKVHTIRNIDYHYVINLDHREKKFEQTLAEFAPYGIKPYRFSAVNGWKLPLEAVQNVSVKLEKGMKFGGMGTTYLRDPIDKQEYASHELIEKVGTTYLCHCATKGMIGCILSHLSIIEDAIRSKYKVIWICEDDIEVVRDPHILSKYIDDLDRVVGRKKWDLFYTFRDYRDKSGNYLKSFGANYRPNINTKNQEKYNINKPITKDLLQVGSRFGTQSMIWTEQGLKKVMNYYKKYKIFLPYDLDVSLIPGINIYSVEKDVVTNKLEVESDLGVDHSRRKS